MWLFFSLQKGRIQSVTPVTSAQLVAAEEVSEGIFKINDKEAGMVRPFEIKSLIPHSLNRSVW